MRPTIPEFDLSRPRKGRRGPASLRSPASRASTPAHSNAPAIVARVLQSRSCAQRVCVAGPDEPASVRLSAGSCARQAVFAFAQSVNVMAGLVPAIHAAPQRQIVVGCAGFFVYARDIGEQSDAVFDGYCAGMTRCDCSVSCKFNRFCSTGQLRDEPGHDAPKGPRFRLSP
jgi:hypothetical protein